jgi:hypothetical protein
MLAGGSGEAVSFPFEVSAMVELENLEQTVEALRARIFAIRDSL